MTNTDVVKKLIGSIHPYGSSHIDEQRLENLKAMCELVSDLLSEIHEVSKAKERHEASMKNMGVYADNFLKEMADETNR